VKSSNLTFAVLGWFIALLLCWLIASVNRPKWDAQDRFEILTKGCPTDIFEPFGLILVATIVLWARGNAL